MRIENISKILKINDIKAVELRDDSDDNIKRFDGYSPASCAFWKAESNIKFYTTEEDHHCSIGRVTHGFNKAHEIYDMEDFKLLKSLGWINEEDISKLPTLPTHKMIIYSSINETDNPDLLIFFGNAEQVMLIIDACEKGNIPYNVRTKPTCAILAEAYNIKGVVIGLGCTPSRLRTPYSINDLFVAIHYSIIERLMELLDEIVRANDLVCQNKELLT